MSLCPTLFPTQGERTNDDDYDDDDEVLVHFYTLNVSAIPSLPCNLGPLQVQSPHLVIRGRNTQRRGQGEVWWQVNIPGPLQ